MKKIVLSLLVVSLFVSCDQLTQLKTQILKNDEPVAVVDSFQLLPPIDTLALTLDALRQKRLPDRYKQNGDVKTKILSFTGTKMQDIPVYIFKDSMNNELEFNKNSTRFNLLVKSKRATPENGGFDPNPAYVNRHFRVVWRNITLVSKPTSEEEYYNQELDEIIYLKEMNEFLLKVDKLEAKEPEKTDGKAQKIK